MGFEIDKLSYVISCFTVNHPISHKLNNRDEINNYTFSVSRTHNASNFWNRY